jgi:hypothetical protein
MPNPCQSHSDTLNRLEYIYIYLPWILPVVYMSHYFTCNLLIQTVNIFFYENDVFLCYFLTFCLTVAPLLAKQFNI